MTSRIVCVSPNTSTDRISVISGFATGGTFRTVRSFDQAGGSGTHAAYVIDELGGSSHSIVMLGGANGLRWQTAAKTAAMSYDAVAIDGENRSSFVLIDDLRGKIAEVIDAGPQVTAPEAETFLRVVVDAIEGAALLVLSGSIPPGMPETLYRTIIQSASLQRLPVVVDAHSAPLQYALEACPWLIKPNLDEFHQLMQIGESTMSQRISLLQSQTGAIAENILLSMSEMGALLSTSTGVWFIAPPSESVTLPDTEAINPVGSGDAMVGATCKVWLETHDLVLAAKWGMAASWANLGSFGVPEVDAAHIERLVNLIDIEQVA